MRGKGFLLSMQVKLLRITPAYAGKSLIGLQNPFASKDHPRVCGEKRDEMAARAHQWRDHPRVCGEKISRGAPKMPLLGSPPRMRGKVIPSQI